MTKTATVRLTESVRTTAVFLYALSRETLNKIVCGRAADLLLPCCGLKNGKYCAAVASTSWLTDAAYPLRVHTVFPHFPNLAWKQNLSLPALADFIRASLG